MPSTRMQSGGAPDSVRTIFQDNPSTDFRTSYEELSSLVSSYPTTIGSIWRKKSVVLRSKCLTQAWASASPGQRIPDRRLRLSERLLGVDYTDPPSNLQNYLPIVEFLFACINLEQLANNPATLLNLIYSRSVKHPSNFGRSDYSNFVDPVLKLFRLVDSQNETSVIATVVMIQNDESNYGVINMLSRQSDHYQQGIYKRLFCNVECGGTWLMKWQKTIIDFCLYCVKDILGPGDLQNKPTCPPGAEKLLEGVQNFSIPPVVGSSRSTIRLTLPYTIPKEFDLQDAYTRAQAHLRFAEDHISLLRTDPDYLLYEIELRLAHREEHILDTTGRKGNAESSKSVGDTIAKIIHSSYARVLVWNEICILFEDAIQIMSIIQSFWYPPGSNPILDEKIQMIHTILCFCEVFSKSAITMNACGGPQLRHHFLRLQTSSFTRKMAVAVRPGLTPSSIFKDNPIDGIFMCISLTGKAWQADILSLNTAANEIEHIMTTDHPELKSHVHPWLMNILSDAAAIFDIQENLECHIPGIELPNYIKITDNIARLSTCIDEFADMWPSVDFSAVLGGDLMGWERMLKVADGDGIMRFWAVIDEQIGELTGGQTLDGWVESPSGRLAARRDGKWMWQGKVFLAEGEDRDTREEVNSGDEESSDDEESSEDEGGAADEKGNVELPGLVAVAAYDDSEGYEEEQSLGNIARTKNIQPNVTDSRNVKPKLAPLPKETPQKHSATVNIEDALKNIDINENAGRSEKKPTISVSKRAYQAIINLSTGKPLAWKEFILLMDNLGFTATPVGGSMLLFMPENKEDEAISIRHPHPNAALGKHECQWIWKRLNRSYGWGIGVFEREKS